MVVSEVMTAEPRCVEPSASLHDALTCMDDNDFRHLPVVRAGRLVGVVSERDLLEALGWSSGDPEEQDVLATERATRVEQVMTRDVLTADLAEPLSVAVQRMLSRRVGCLPVLDGHDALVGILTERDVAARFVREADRGALAAGDDPAVSAVMSRDLLCASPDTSVQDACSSCHAAGVRHLPVVRSGELAGVVSDRDLRAAARSGTDRRLSVADLMATEVETAADDERLSRAARRMVDLAVSALPVVHEGRLVGILTLTDVLGHTARVLPA